MVCEFAFSRCARSFRIGLTEALLRSFDFIWQQGSRRTRQTGAGTQRDPESHSAETALDGGVGGLRIRSKKVRAVVTVRCGAASSGRG